MRLQCPKCGTNEMAFVEARGHLEVFRCRVCGFEAGSTVSYPIDLQPDPEVSLFVHWRAGTASPAEIHALRDSFPEFRDRSFSELLATVGTKSVKLGVFPRRYAEELAETARAKGLSVEIVQVAAS